MNNNVAHLPEEIGKLIQQAQRRDLAELNMENLVEAVGDVPAYLVYKCRSCGELLKTGTFKNVIAVLVGAANGKQPWNELMRCFHFCDSNRVGLADLIGAHKEEKAE